MREITNRIAEYYGRAAEYMAKFPDEYLWRVLDGERYKSRFRPLPKVEPVEQDAKVIPIKGRRHAR